MRYKYIKINIIIISLFLFFSQTILADDVVNENAIILYFTGTYFELGQKMGKVFKENGIELRKKITDSDIEYNKRYLKYIEEIHPGLIEYFKGIASVYNIDYEKEKHNYNFNPSIFNIEWFGCTGLFVSSKKTYTGKNYIARNFDFMDHKYNFQIFKTESL